MAVRSVSSFFRMPFVSQSTLRSVPMLTTSGCDDVDAVLEDRRPRLRLARLQPLLAESRRDRHDVERPKVASARCHREIGRARSARPACSP